MGVDQFLDNIYGGSEPSLMDRFEILKRPNLRVAVIGSGPALYDFINQIEPNGQKLFVFSNAGKGLGVRDASIEGQEISIPPQGLLSLGYDSTYEEAIECLAQEFTSAAQGRSQRRIALDVSKNLRSVLMRLGTDVAHAFRNSSEFSPIKHYATPIPLESHERLKSFKPAFVKSCIKEKDVIPQKDGAFTINAGYEAYIADVVINATGHGRHNSPILESLKRQNLAQFNPITGALDTDRSGYKLSISGLNVIGPATHVGIDGIESFYVYTKHFAEKFVSDLKREASLAPILDRRLQM